MGAVGGRCLFAHHTYIIMVCDPHKDWVALESQHSLSACTGVYISKTSYVRPGERSLDGFYKAYHTVVYYRYLRFFADGESSRIARFSICNPHSIPPLPPPPSLCRVCDVSNITRGARWDSGEVVSQTQL